MEFTIAHETTYRYPKKVHESFTVVHLQPRSDTHQYCTKFELNVAPRARVFRITIVSATGRSTLPCCPTTTSSRSSRVRASWRPPEPEIPRDIDQEFAQCRPDRRDALRFLAPEPVHRVRRRVSQVCRRARRSGDDLGGWYLRAGHAINETFTYDRSATTVRSNIDESIRRKAGVCQDFAHVLIALCRFRKIPARYVSGYIFSGQEDSVLGAEASHAWCEDAFCRPWAGSGSTRPTTR